MELSKLIHEYGASLQRLCRSYEAHPEKASELNQEIWTAIWLSLDKFEGRCSIRTWIYRVAHNTALTHVSKEAQVKGLISIEDVEGQIVDESSSQTHALENKETIRRIEEVLRTMKFTDRQVFWLYLEGNSQVEIAEVTGLTPTHISSKVSRIKRLLEKLISR